ncbi:YdcF family protein [Clostridium sp.]|uniref:YdcF family protein n=1 Tax=Clostridium sp. TaxID=1506 RepID=UPI00284F3862|nr:YdcF family protein [Clostridium sp.]MDR3595583.1 YdcF family protein [Clostridium sp.]
MKKFWDSILGGILILYIILINLVSSARIAFSVPVALLGIILIIYHFIKVKIKKNEFLFKGFNVIKKIMYLLLICFLGLEAAIISYPKHSDKKVDYILVLGAGLTDGETPSSILQDRLEAAIKNYKENQEEYIVLSGGQGNDEELPESQAMKKYLLDKGIDSNKIIIEDKSRNTNENFKFSKQKIEEHSQKSISQVNVKIVTTDFHVLRSCILAKKNGYIHFDNYSCPTVWYLIPVTYTREAFAIIKSVLFDK